MVSILKKYLKKGLNNIKIIVKILGVLLLVSCSSLTVLGEENYINGYIERVDGKEIITDSTNKPFFFNANCDTEIVYMEYLGPHETVWQEYFDETIIGNGWENGKYTFRAYDEFGNMAECHVYYDTVSPIGKFYNRSEEVENEANLSDEFFYFEISDELSGLDMVYVKYPNTDEYVSYNRGTYLYESGTYYFYGVDYAGNRSKTYQISLNKLPMVDIIYNDENNSIYLTWEELDYSVYVNETLYDKGRVFYDEGIYNIKVIDSNGRIGEETFIIDHLYQYTKTIAPTCSKEGYILYTCLTCGSFKEEINKDKLAHNFNYEYVQGSCTIDECYLKTCTNCNYIEKEVISMAKGHDLYQIKQNPTCTSDGYNAYKCFKCSYEEVIETINSIGHNYQTQIIQEATCTVPGIREFSCLKCLETYQKEIKELGHNYILIDSITINDNEKEVTYKCNNCQEVFKKTEIINQTNESYATIFQDYTKHLVIILISVSGLWSIYMGMKYITAKNKNEKLEAKQYIKNYIIGLVVIFIIIMVSPLIINGIKSIL